MGIDELLGESLALTAKNERVAGLVGGGEVTLFPDRSEQLQPRARVGMAKMGHVEMALQAHQGPVVETRPTHGFVVNPKAQAADQVQGTIEGSREPSDISGVLRDLGV